MPSAMHYHGRSLLSLRRDQIHAMDGHNENQEQLHLFQLHVSNLFSSLSSSNEQQDLLSLSWIRKLLHSFLLCQEKFHTILSNNHSILSNPPLDRLLSDFHDRAVKSLDVCNAIRDGIQQLMQCQKHIEIVILSLDRDRQIHRAKKALMDLAVLTLDEKDPVSVLAMRNRSFSRRRKQGCCNGHFRSLSWSVSRSWSAARIVNAIGNGISAPRGGNEMANTIFTMNLVLYFVMWALVAAIPCQDRGVFQANFSIGRSFCWGNSVLLLHERIVEESKRRERRNSVGLMKEIYGIEKCTRHLLEITSDFLQEEKVMEMRKCVEELGVVFDAFKEGLEPCERLVREVFHRILRTRMESLDLSHKME